MTDRSSDSTRPIVLPSSLSPIPSEPREHILQFFSFAHLPEWQRQICQPFAALAEIVATTMPRNPERSVALRKLLEAKDAAVRAVLAGPS